MEVATGGGKTRFALACAAAIADADPTMQIVVPTTALADQWYVSILEETGASAEDIALLTSKAGAADLRRYNIVVINSARSLSASIWAGRRRFLIVDECHHAGSPENAKALRGESWASLGLSATPERSYDEGLDDVLVPALGQIIYNYTLRDATEDGVLNRFQLTNVRVTLPEQDQQEYERLTRAIGRAARPDERTEELVRLLRARARVANNSFVRLPTAVHLAERHRGARTLIFHESIDSAETIFALLRDRDHSATLYHSRLGAHLRRENLRLFRRGVYDSLVTCRALDEGVNVPEVEVAVIAAATASDRQRIQRLGRVLRPSPGKDLAQVYTIYATDIEEERLRMESELMEGFAAVTWMKASRP